MQSAQSIARALYRIVFRGGTPQRIQFSKQLTLWAMGTSITAGAIAGRWLLGMSVIEIGLALFTLTSSLYIGAALLTRSVPRARLRASLQTVLLLTAAGAVVLVLLIPLRFLGNPFVMTAGILVLAGVLSGTVNAVQFARGAGRLDALIMTLAFAAVAGAFYATLRWLLETVYA